MASSGFYSTMSGVPLERERETMNKHYQMELPTSLNQLYNESFNVYQIESQLHLKLSQIVARDFDRYSELMKLLRSKAKRKCVEDDNRLRVYREDFHDLLTNLQVFAPKEVAHQLFDMYDSQGVGYLFIHNFVSKARAPDFGPKEFFTPVLPNNPVKQGQKLFPHTKNYGVPVQARMPTNDVYQMTVNMMCKEIKKKMEMLSSVGQTNSDFRARRNLKRQFEYFDRKPAAGLVSVSALQRVLDGINYPVEKRHIDMLMKKYGDHSNPQFFKYRSFINKIYPVADEQPLTSLPMGREKGKALWEFMSSIDTDGDGTVSLEEMLAFKRSLPFCSTPPPCTPPTPGSPDKNLLSQIASLTTRKAVATSRPGSRQIMNLSRTTTPRPPTGSRPPSTARLAPRASRPPTGTRAYNVSRNGSRTAREQPSSRTSRPSASRVLSRPGSRIAGSR